MSKPLHQLEHPPFNDFVLVNFPVVTPKVYLSVIAALSTHAAQRTF